MSKPRFSSQKAEAMAGDLGIDPSEIEGTGKGGRITISDVRDADPMPPPSHLDDAGRALWFAVRFSVPEGYLLDEREQSILAMAAEQADTLAALEKIVAEEGMMTRGSKGQRVVHPAVQEARLQRQSIGQLLTRLSFPDEAGTGGAASARGRHAANSRWAKRGAQAPQAGSLF